LVNVRTYKDKYKLWCKSNKNIQIILSWVGQNNTESKFHNTRSQLLVVIVEEHAHGI